MKRMICLSFYLAAGLVAFALLVWRDMCTWLPHMVWGSLPNFAPTAFSPLLLAANGKAVTCVRCQRFILSMFGAMCLYEVMQIWMPRRTFDLADIAASALGSVIAILAAPVLFTNSSSHDGAPNNTA